MKERVVTNHSQKLHRIRTEQINGHLVPEIEGELKVAYRSLQLHWLSNYPEYRRLVKEKVSKAARKAENRSRKIDREHENVDYLGHEIEGCG